MCKCLRFAYLFDKGAKITQCDLIASSETISKLIPGALMETSSCPSHSVKMFCKGNNKCTCGKYNLLAGAPGPWMNSFVGCIIPCESFTQHFEMWWWKQGIQRDSNFLPLLQHVSRILWCSQTCSRRQSRKVPSVLQLTSISQAQPFNTSAYCRCHDYPKKRASLEILCYWLTAATGRPTGYILPPCLYLSIPGWLGAIATLVYIFGLWDAWTKGGMQV